MAKISIIVPVYNSEKFLKKCLNSLREQTLKEIEILMINDGSTDNSLEICQNYTEKNQNFKLINLKNQGVSNARNIGIEKSIGKYLLFVDSDDWLELDACDKLYREIEKRNVDCILFSSLSISSNSKITKQPLGQKNRKFDKSQYFKEIICSCLGPTDDIMRNPKKLDALVPTWNKLYKSEIIKKNKIRFIDLNKVPSECQLFNFNYFLYSNNAYYIKDCLYNYRRSNMTSITKGYRKDLTEKWFFWIDYVKKIIDCEHDKVSKDLLYRSYYNRICCSVIPLTGNLFKKNSIDSWFYDIKKILNDSTYIEAFDKLKFKKMKFYWKIYFISCKYRFVLNVLIMSFIMRKMIERNKK